MAGMTDVNPTYPFTLDIHPCAKPAGHFAWAIRKHGKLLERSDRPHHSEHSARQRGEVNAEVSSAHPLSDEQLAALKDTLRASAGKDVQLITKVDPTLLGGLIVKMGSRMIDSSLRTKLTSLKTVMKEVR